MQLTTCIRHSRNQIQIILSITLTTKASIKYFKRNWYCTTVSIFTGSEPSWGGVFGWSNAFWAALIAASASEILPSSALCAWPSVLRNCALRPLQTVPHSLFKLRAYADQKESTKQSINRHHLSSVNQSFNQLINQLISQSFSQWNLSDSKL